MDFHSRISVKVMDVFFYIAHRFSKCLTSFSLECLVQYRYQLRYIDVAGLVFVFHLDTESNCSPRELYETLPSVFKP